MSENAQHISIAVLAALSLILSIVLVSGGKHGSERFAMMSGSESARQRSINMMNPEAYAAPSPYNSTKEKFQWAGNPYPLISTMNPAQVQSVMNQPSCAAAVASYCPLACKSQNVLGGASFANQLQAVQNSCGKQFPVLGACAMQNPSCQMMPMILGGTHSNKFAGV
jgi:hypothetical protein